MGNATDQKVSHCWKPRLTFALALTNKVDLRDGLKLRKK